MLPRPLDLFQAESYDRMWESGKNGGMGGKRYLIHVSQIGSFGRIAEFPGFSGAQDRSGKVLGSDAPQRSCACDLKESALTALPSARGWTEYR